MLSEEAREFLEKNEIIYYTINPDRTIDIDEDVSVCTDKSKLPVKFRKVVGHFDCDYCDLTSLEGAPSHVNGNFYCYGNKLTSLHNVHKIIKEINGRLYFRNNYITSSVLGLLMIKGVKEILLDNKEVEKILNKYLRQGRAGVIGAQQELLDVGLDEFAKL